MSWRYSDLVPLNGVLNAGGVWKILIFDQYLALSRKYHEIGPYVWPCCGMQIYELIVPFSMTLNDSNPDFKGIPLFDVEDISETVRDINIVRMEMEY